MKNNEGFTCLGLLVFALASIVVASLMNGWVLSTFWEWFVVAQFNLPKIGVVEAIGLSMTVKLIASTVNVTKQEDKTTGELVIELIVYSFAYPLLVLGIGYIVHLFV